jgi:hypothetical protein
VARCRLTNALALPKTTVPAPEEAGLFSSVLSMAGLEPVMESACFSVMELLSA